MRASVLGMGSMGREVARVLLGQGHDVTVWNRTAGKADDLVKLGAADLSGKEPTEAVRGSEVLLTSLSDDEAVRSVLLDGGVAAAVAKGSEGGSGGVVVVEMSTVSPGTTRELADAVGKGCFVASPILGAPQAVAKRQAGYLVAGPLAAVERLGKLFDSLSERHRYVGEDPGRALELKILANNLLLSGLAVLAEVVATGQALGMGDDLLLGFLRESPLVAPGLLNRVDDVASGDHEGWFTTALGAKDVRLASELASAEGIRLPVTEEVLRRYEQAAASGYGSLDIAAVVELLRHHN